MKYHLAIRFFLYLLHKRFRLSPTLGDLMCQISDTRCHMSDERPPLLILFANIAVSRSNHTIRFQVHTLLVWPLSVFSSRYIDSLVNSIQESSICNFGFCAISSFNTGSHDRTLLWHNIYTPNIAPKRSFITRPSIKGGDSAKPKVTRGN